MGGREEPPTHSASPGTSCHPTTRHTGRLLALRLDVTDRAAVFDVVAQAVDRFGRLDIVVNNAGALFAGMVEFTEAQARAQPDLNFFGALWVSQAVLPTCGHTGASCRSPASVRWAEKAVPAPN
ncbi:SDR family NAD(P)-dependent oxidoreductase [Actinophytocola sp.]|uniref:SDR family NAD(P)-dependent oxidoreductase n=1 Tax=Actinophytocola sp. TaxID=1872138 RepID=UPI002ED2019A